MKVFEVYSASGALATHSAVTASGCAASSALPSAEQCSGRLMPDDFAQQIYRLPLRELPSAGTPGTCAVSGCAL
ncbi:MAG: hypothetical protein OXF86_11140 [Caldilineaceae bacterium]|nr:hypothetical protein [Caldilineaceae bacterium]